MAPPVTFEHDSIPSATLPAPALVLAPGVEAIATDPSANVSRVMVLAPTALVAVLTGIAPESESGSLPALMLAMSDAWTSGAIPSSVKRAVRSARVISGARVEVDPWSGAGLAVDARPADAVPAGMTDMSIAMNPPASPEAANWRLDAMITPFGARRSTMHARDATTTT